MLKTGERAFPVAAPLGKESSSDGTENDDWHNQIQDWTENFHVLEIFQNSNFWFYYLFDDIGNVLHCRSFMKVTDTMTLWVML